MRKDLVEATKVKNDVRSAIIPILDEAIAEARAGRWNAMVQKMDQAIKKVWAAMSKGR